jgi:hypothetical protein
MGYNPENNTISVNVDKDLEKKINTATSTAEIFQALKDAYEQQGLTEKDYFNGDIVYATTKAYEAPVLSRTLTINGVAYRLEGSTEAELYQREVELHRELQTGTTSTPASTPEQPRTNGRYVDETEDSTAVDSVIQNYLQRHGIAPEALKEISDRNYTQAWQSAAEEFRSRHGSGWAGGNENLQQIGKMIMKLGLMDSDDKVAALEAAYAEIQKRGLYVRDTQESQAAQAESDMASAMSFEDLRALGHRAIGIPPVNSNFRN